MEALVVDNVKVKLGDAAVWKQNSPRLTVLPSECFAGFTVYLACTARS